MSAQHSSPLSPPAVRGSSRVAWVDAAKGLSILLVVAHHSVMFLQTHGLAPPAVVAANTALASMRMPLFFLASGLFVAGPLAAPWRTLLHKRIAFFLYLFVLWTLLRFAFFHIPAMAAVDPYDSTNVVDLALALLIPGSGMWFIYALALFAVIGKLIKAFPCGCSSVQRVCCPRSSEQRSCSSTVTCGRAWPVTCSSSCSAGTPGTWSSAWPGPARRPR